MRKILIVLVGVVALVLAWREMVPQDGDPQIDAPIEIVTVPGQDLEAKQIAEALPIPDDRPAPESSRAAAEALAPPLSETEAATALYSKKYRDATMDRLVLARYELDRKVQSERTRISKEIIDSGKLTTQVIPPGEAVKTWGTKKGGPPVVSGVTVFGETLDDGTPISRHATIEPEVYPEFHALEMEHWWLESEVRRRERLAQREK